MTLSIWNIGILTIGYTVALLVGHFGVGPIVDRLWKHYVPSLERHPALPAIIGALDLVLYISSYLVGVPEFIVAWLVIKVAGEWSPSKADVDRPLYHIFLIGNGLNIIIGVGTALVIQALLRP